MATTRLTIVIPAFNEAELIGNCIRSVRDAWQSQSDRRQSQFSYELIVTDNNSQDATAELARGAGALVVFEPVNQIARARNAGAGHATGDWLLFIDADSELHPRTLELLLATIARGDCGGGGCVIRLAGAPWWGRLMVGFWNLLSRSCRWAAGSFLFCQTAAFREVGGFDEQYFAAEEIYLSQVLKQWCRRHRLRFQILHGFPHTSSARKFHAYSFPQMLAFIGRTIWDYPRAVRSRKALDFFYAQRHGK